MYELYKENFACWNGKNLVFILRTDHVDHDAINSSVFHDEYQLRNFPFADNDVILDVGACTGGEAVAIATLNPTIKVISVEPIPENVELLKQNLLLNGVKNVIVCDQPMAGTVRPYRLQYGNVNTVSGRKHRFVSNVPVTDGGDSIVKESITLPLIFEKYKLDRVKLFRIDAEGPEYEILEKCPKAILEKIDYIIGEHHNVLRSQIVEIVKDIFVEMPCLYQEAGHVGHFKLKNKRIK